MYGVNDDFLDKLNMMCNLKSVFHRSTIKNSDEPSWKKRVETVGYDFNIDYNHSERTIGSINSGNFLNEIEEISSDEIF